MAFVNTFSLSKDSCAAAVRPSRRFASLTPCVRRVRRWLFVRQGQKLANHAETDFCVTPMQLIRRPDENMLRLTGTTDGLGWHRETGQIKLVPRRVETETP